MNRKLLFIAAIFSSVLANTQDYQCIKADAEYMFWDGAQYHAVSIDSVQIQPDHSSYYNFPAIGGEDDNFDCLSKDWSSWIGRKTDIYPNGDHLFYNYLQQPVLIKAQTETGSTWTCYTFADNRFVECTLFEMEEMSFLGTSDTVKKIAFQVKDQNGNAIAHPLNTKELWISKNHGLLKALNFKLFPDLNDFMDSEILENDLCGISSPGSGIQNLTFDQIFNFGIGDEFHILQYSDMVYYYNEYKAILTVLDKYWANDSVLYFVFKRCAQQNIYSYPTPDTTLRFNDTINEIINMTYSMYAGLNHSPEKYFTIGDTNNYEYLWFTQSNNTEHDKLQKIQIDGFISNYPHECIEVIVTKDKYYEGEYYLQDLGGPYWHYGEWGDEFFRGLVYYKKGVVEWGVPYSCDSLLSRINEPVIQECRVTVSPNPMHTSATLTIAGKQEGDYQLQLYNSVGILVRECQFQTTELDINRSDLTDGIYFFILTRNRIIVGTGKLIVN